MIERIKLEDHIEPNVSVIGVVGLIEGAFLREILDPNIEPWFVVNYRFPGRILNRSLFTKDVKSYYDASRFYSKTSMLDSLRWRSGPEIEIAWEHRRYQFPPEERVFVKKAIEQYVGEI